MIVRHKHSDWVGYIAWYKLECDNCGAEASEEFEDFYNAVEWKKSEGRRLGWSCSHRSGEWEDFCPECTRAIKFY